MTSVPNESDKKKKLMTGEVSKLGLKRKTEFGFTVMAGRRM